MAKQDNTGPLLKVTGIIITLVAYAIGGYVYMNVAVGAAINTHSARPHKSAATQEQLQRMEGNLREDLRLMEERLRDDIKELRQKF